LFSTLGHPAPCKYTVIFFGQTVGPQPSVEGASFQPATPNSTSLSILHFNASSLLLKLAATAEALQPTVICIVGTWLLDQITESEISFVGYVTYRLDRNHACPIIYLH